jgi:hypothetical protein
MRITLGNANNGPLAVISIFVWHLFLVSLVPPFLGSMAVDTVSGKNKAASSMTVDMYARSYLATIAPVSHLEPHGGRSSGRLNEQTLHCWCVAFDYGTTGRP